MKKIGIISDTHNTFDYSVRDFLKDCDEIWHAGDIGTIQMLDTIAGYKTLKAVYGNIDDSKLRLAAKKTEIFMCENMKVVMTHIGGYPKHYYPEVKALIEEHSPQIVITGHSHILRVMYDKQLSHMHINPGAAGSHGFHKVRTAIRITIDGDKITDMEVGEWPRV